jgi:hypothetical protein
MRIYRLQIRNYRGIRRLDCILDHQCICLVGPGDSTKTTILDAIELVLSPRFAISIDDTDFFEMGIQENIVITATVGPVPAALKAEGKFGLALQGCSAEGVMHDEPAEGDDPVISVRLQIDSTLEPKWAVVNERLPEGKPISARDRELLGLSRLGASVDRHLTWNRGSVLARITADVESLPQVLAEAHRQARKAVDGQTLGSFQQAATKAQELGADYGVHPLWALRPGLDVGQTSTGLALYDGLIWNMDVPSSSQETKVLR